MIQARSYICRCCGSKFSPRPFDDPNCCRECTECEVTQPASEIGERILELNSENQKLRAEIRQMKKNQKGGVK